MKRNLKLPVPKIEKNIPFKDKAPKIAHKWGFLSELDVGDSFEVSCENTGGNIYQAAARYGIKMSCRQSRPGFFRYWRIA